jgi:hypothetical protein
MVAVQAVAHEGSLLSTLLGFGAVALLVASLAALHVGRRARLGPRRSLRRLVRGKSRRTSPATSRVAADVAAPASSSSSASRGSAPPAMSASPVGEVREPPAAKTVGPTPPRLAAGRCSWETLEPLARRVEGSRRIAVADARVTNVLTVLPRDRWLVERYALISGHRVPFLLLGEAGVLTLWPVESGPSWGDIEFTNDVANVIKSLLPAYRGPVRVGFCRAFERGMPRWWSQGPAGAWIMGLDGIEPWLQHFGLEHGLGAEDISRFNTLAGQHWDRRRSPARFPPTPNRG